MRYRLKNNQPVAIDGLDYQPGQPVDGLTDEQIIQLVEAGILVPIEESTQEASGESKRTGRS